MKILKEKRGFTTNSSSAADWNEPEPSRFDKDGNLIIDSDVLNSSKSEAESKESAFKTVTATKPKESSNSGFMKDNIIMISVLVASVLGLFVLERIIRRILKKKKITDETAE